MSPAYRSTGVEPGLRELMRGKWMLMSRNLDGQKRADLGHRVEEHEPKMRRAA
jgi:hypothetical protein